MLLWFEAYELDMERRANIAREARANRRARQAREMIESTRALEAVTAKIEALGEEIMALIERCLGQTLAEQFLEHLIE